MNEYEQFLNEVGIHDKGTLTDDDEYVIEFDDPDVQSRMFSALEKSNKIGLDVGTQKVDFSKYQFTNLYKSDSYEIELFSDFDDDEYKLTVRKRIED